MLDLIIKNGMVLDGSGKRGVLSDVAIQKDRIVEVGLLPGAEALRVVDARGQIVCPGFVDMHSHTDYTLPICPSADNLVSQGITTAVIGNCGTSLAPLFPENRAEIIPTLGVLDGPLPWDQWGDFSSYLSWQQQNGMGVNVVPLLGHNTLRKGIAGFGAAATNRAQMKRIQLEIERAMDGGAFGMSTGLIYPPGLFATTEELIDWTRPIGKRGGFYFSHIRNEAWLLLSAVDEAIRIGQETGARVEISHFKAAFRDNWDLAAQALERIDRAREEGVRVQADMYPYTSAATYLRTAIPDWAHDGGAKVLLARLRSKEERERIVETSKTEGFFRNLDWGTVIFAKAPRMPQCEGHLITELAEAAGKTPWNWVMDALIETELEVECFYPMISEDNLRLQLGIPWMMFGTDAEGRPFSGPLTRGLNHPRGFGTFPRILGRYVREEHVLTLEDAIHRMTGLPAEFLHLQDRGVIKAGVRADLVVFDAKGILDHSEYVSPYQKNSGIQSVLVNGQFAVDQGELTGVCAGEVIPFSKN
ncbi:MAG: D-aminoacylase [Chloroflexi bacterium]|nr:D-aminoacylase [Chloroflexota bacterium]